MIKKYLVPIIAVIIVIIGCIYVNIKTTEALSPIGNTEDNYLIVSKEFGDDFSEFIKDKSPVKIYLGEEGDKQAVVKVFNKEIKLTSKNIFVKAIGTAINTLKNISSNIKDKFIRNTENSNIPEDNSEEIDDVVDDFIKNIENDSN
jgi:DNA-binding protein